MRASVKILTVLLLVLTLGLHWAVFQTVAWTSMLISYSRDASFKEAVTKTFDGQHPCSLCKAIQKGRAEEKKQEQKQSKSGVKLDPGLLWQAATFDFRREQPPIAALDFSAASRADEPPKPRPRGLCPDTGVRR